MKSIALIHTIVEPENNLSIEDGKIVNHGEASEINPWDLYVLEAAMQIKEKHGGEVIALSMGSSLSNKALIRALAFGCDKAILLKCPDSYFFNSSFTAYILKHAIELIGTPDLILGACVYSDINDPTLLIQLSRMLNVKYVSLAKNIYYQCENDEIKITREENGIEYDVLYKPPLAILVSKEFGEPRHLSLKALQRASKEEIIEMNFEQLGISVIDDDMEYSNLKINDMNKKVCEFITGETPRETVENLVRILKEEKMLQ